MMRERQQATQETQKVEVSKLLDLLNEAKERELKAQKLQAEHENLCHEYEAQVGVQVGLRKAFVVFLRSVVLRKEEDCFSF